MAAVIVRPACAKDVGGLHRAMTSAFNLTEGSERWSQCQLLASDWRSFLAVEQAGEVVGAARIGRDPLRYGETAVVLKGDVGHVSIVRELQGQGLGTLLMQEVVRFMDVEGFHLSRLGGLNAFYERFGYVPFPRRFYEFPIEPVGAGAMTVSPEQHLRPSAQEAAHLRLYDAGRDWAERFRLYEVFHRGRTGSLIEERPAAPPSASADLSSLSWVYGTDRRLLAFARGTKTGEEVGIHDAAYDLEHPEALAAVVKRVLWEAARQGAKRALGRLPFDERVEAALVTGGVFYVLREVQSAPASNMLLLVNLTRFLEAATSEWSRRLLSTDLKWWTGLLELRVQGQTANIVFDKEGVQAAPVNGVPDAQLNMKPRAFLLAALGHRGWCEVAQAREGNLPRALEDTLAVVFRREPCASGPLG